MNTIADSIIFISIPLITIIIPVFVFAVSLLGRAIEKAAEEKKRKEEMQGKIVEKAVKKLKEASEKIKTTSKTDELIRDIVEYKKEVKKATKDLRDIKAAPECLTVKGSVLKPGFCFLMAFILSSFLKCHPFMKFNDLIIDLMPLNILSLIFVMLGCWFIYQCLKVVQEISLTTEQAQLQRTIEAFETALQRHEEKQGAELGLDFKTSPPFIFPKATESKIEWDVYLNSGKIAHSADILFSLPKEFDSVGILSNPSTAFPGYIEVFFKIGELKKGLSYSRVLKIKTPTNPGKFKCIYNLYCEGFVSEDREFEIEVK